MTEARKVGRMLEEFRQRSGLTKTALADAVGVPLSFLIKVSSGGTTLTMDRLERAIAALGLSPAEAASLQHANLRARANNEGLELERRASAASGAALPDGAMPVRFVPVLAAVPAGDPKSLTDGDYPAGCAESFFPVPECNLRNDPNAFALRIDGDSMLPRLKHGDIVIVSPNRALERGKPAVVKCNGEATCKIWNEVGGNVVLKPLNPDYPEIRCAKSHIDWAYPVVMLVSTV